MLSFPPSQKSYTRAMLGTLVSNCWAMPRIVPPLAGETEPAGALAGEPVSQRGCGSCPMAAGAETGHLVLSTLHTNDTIQSVSRILDTFPSSNQPQIRQQLSLALLAIVAQQLVPR